MRAASILGSGSALRRCVVPAVTALLLGALATPGAVAVLGSGAWPAAAGASGARSDGRANTWVPTGSLSLPRSGATATLLPSGQVLVAGGAGNTAELYDPTTGTFSFTGSMSVARIGATATLLGDGQVLVAGGCCDGHRQLSSAELYDPDSGTWAPTGSMIVARSSATATLLPDGDVLVAGGGCNGHQECNSAEFLSTLRSAELYNPGSGTWRRTGSMHEGREFFTASLLDNGQVLAAGGFNSCDDSFCTDLATAEVYDSASGRWTETGAMSMPREQQVAAVLPDGRVLVAGGLIAPGGGAGNTRLRETEVYDPASGTWRRSAPMAVPHYGGTATVLTNGWVLVAGGNTRAAQVFDPTPTPGLWVPVGPMSTTRTGQTATLLGDGHVLVAGGAGPDGLPQQTAETFLAGAGPLVVLQPGGLDFGAQQVGSTSRDKRIHVTNVGDRPLRVFGVSMSGANPTDFSESTTCPDRLAAGATCLLKMAFQPRATGHRTATVGLTDNAPLSPQRVPLSGDGNAAFVWAPTGSLGQGRDDATATSLRDGTVLITGGESSLGDLSSSETYHPQTRTFSSTGALNAARAYSTAVRLRDGRVLVAGGLGGAAGDQRLSSAEIYDPASGAWTTTGDMPEAGYALTSTLLPNGEVLVAGFGTGTAALYDPSTGTWSDTAPLQGTNGPFATASLLSDGSVLLAGGGTDAAQLYDPVANAWTATGSMNVARTRATASVLPDHEVLVAGGYPPDTGVPTATSELYNPSTGTWKLTVGSMNSPRAGHTATVLANGWVMVAGGCTASCNRDDVTNSVEEYDAPAQVWVKIFPGMNQARFAATATLMRDGAVLMAGGSNYCCHYYKSAETYTLATLRTHPRSGPVGTDVTVRGYGFYADEPVSITWDGKRLATQNSGREGGFAYRFSVADGTQPGKHHLHAVGQTSHAQATTVFTVTP